MKEFAYIHEHGRVPDALRKLPFLGSFDEDQLDDVLDSSNYVQGEPGDVIIDEGAIDSRIYILLSGEVEVRKQGKVLATIGRVGEVFGELAVVNEDRRSASVMAKTEVVCLAVDQKFLQDIKPREEYPAFYAALYEFIARLTAGRLEATTRQLSKVQNELRLLKEKIAGKRKLPARPIKRTKPKAAKRKLPARSRR
ncbi:MAG: cyclic nucleotide-binding domain-containing protein [Verrucomicrobia bacterium]|nr:cyclic nucleotide-binding domain-containing protein [Verrucomicrobiota bacterium]